MPEVEVGNIICTEGDNEGKKVVFHFNPTEYTVTKANQFNLSPNKGGNVPNWEFFGGAPRIISLGLLFDSSMIRHDQRGQEVPEEDVRDNINQLFKFMLVDETLKQQDGRDSHMGRPPQCKLQWAKDTKSFFYCYIQDCSAQYLMFNSEGIPIRARVYLVLKEAVDPKQKAGTNPTSRGEPGRRARLVQEGDRLDLIAYQEYGDANEWRLIAQANRLFNPLDLCPGMVLAIPPR